MYPPPTALLTARTDGEEADKAALQGQLDRLKEENERLKLQVSFSFAWCLSLHNFNDDL